MTLTLTMVDTRSMVLVVLIILAVWPVLWTSARKRTLFHNVLNQRLLTFSFFRETGVFPLVLAVCGKNLCLKLNPCQILVSCFASRVP